MAKKKTQKKAKKEFQKNFLKIILPILILITLACIYFYYQSSDSGEINLDGCGEESVIYKNNELCWQQGIMPGNSKNFEDAKNYCEELVLGNHDNWRLPTLQELESIIDYSFLGLVINKNIFKGTQNIHYWTITSYTGKPGFHWYINFEKGYQGFAPDFKKGYGVRCVRDNTIF